MPVTVREATASDAPFLAEMLVEAAFWRTDGPRGTVDDVLDEPKLAHYVSGWPRAGDRGVVAADSNTGIAAGAAWLRYFTDDDPGYGFVAPGIPEMAIAIVARRRGQGIGKHLLEALIAVAREHTIPAISLSVDPDNFARHLYEQHGFVPDREAASSLTMLLHLR